MQKLLIQRTGGVVVIVYHDLRNKLRHRRAQ
jgi:hypothetical protein